MKSRFLSFILVTIFAFFSSSIFLNNTFASTKKNNEFQLKKDSSDKLVLTSGKGIQKNNGFPKLFKFNFYQKYNFNFLLSNVKYFISKDISCKDFGFISLKLHQKLLLFYQVANAP